MFLKTTLLSTYVNDQSGGYILLDQEAVNDIVDVIISALPEYLDVKVPYDLLELQKAFENGHNTSIDKMKTVLLNAKEE